MDGPWHGGRSFDRPGFDPLAVAYAARPAIHSCVLPGVKALRLAHRFHPAGGDRGITRFVIGHGRAEAA